MTKEERKLVWVRRVLFGLALIGLYVATYLFIAYSTEATIACGGGSHGCDVVRLSRWAKMYGISTPVLGMLFYAGMASLLVIRTMKPSWNSRWMYRLTMIGATVGLIESVFLTGVQALEIKQYCTWCLASAVAATLLFIVSWGDRPHHLDTHDNAKEFRIQFFMALFVIIVGSVSMYFLFAQKSGGQAPVIEQVSPSTEQAEAARKALAPSSLEYAGSASATITIIEFVDFECPACRQFYPEFQKVKQKLGDRLRYAYRMFPLPIHQHSFDSAVAAVCAKQQGMFYQYADALMEEEGLERTDLIRRAAELRLNMDQYTACLNDKAAKDEVRKDLEDGDALGVNSTPTIFINDTMIQGLPNADQLMDLISK